jgi:hypothetical protein
MFEFSKPAAGDAGCRRSRESDIFWAHQSIDQLLHLRRFLCGPHHRDGSLSRHPGTRSADTGSAGRVGNVAAAQGRRSAGAASPPDSQVAQLTRTASAATPRRNRTPERHSRIRPGRRSCPPLDAVHTIRVTGDQQEAGMINDVAATLGSRNRALTLATSTYEC